MSDMHPEDIKAELRKRGYTLTEVARRAGVTKQTIAMSLRGRVSARAETAVAECLGRDARAIWPSRYRSDGARIHLKRVAA